VINFNRINISANLVASKIPPWGYPYNRIYSANSGFTVAGIDVTTESGNNAVVFLSDSIHALIFLKSVKMAVFVAATFSLFWVSFSDAYWYID